MNLRKTLVLGALAIAACLALVLRTHNWGAGRASDGQPRLRNLLEEPFDRYAYLQRGRWLPAGGRPYVDVFSEYPQLTTWFFGLAYLCFDADAERGEPFGSERAARESLLAAGMSLEQVEHALGKPPGGALKPAQQAALLAQVEQSPRGGPQAAADLKRAFEAQQRLTDELARNARAYGDVHQVFMAVLFFAAFGLTALLLRELGHAPAWALLWFLPGPLYFAFSRFDVLLVVELLLALLLQFRGRAVAAGSVLGLAIMTKMWPALLVPLFLSHNLWSALDAGRARAQPVRWPALLARRVLLPGAAALAVCALVLAISYFSAGGGADGHKAALDVWLYQAAERKENHASVLALMTTPERWGWFDPSSRERWKSIFRVLIVALPLGLAALGPRSRGALIHALIASTLGCVIFQNFHSPQWVLWFLPLALLVAPRFRAYALLVVLTGVVIYAQMPLLVYGRDAQGAQLLDAFWKITNLRVSVFFAFLAAAMWGFFRCWRADRSAARAQGRLGAART